MDEADSVAGGAGSSEATPGGIAPPAPRETTASKQATDLPPKAEAIGTPAWSEPQEVGAQGRSVMRSVGLDLVRSAPGLRARMRAARCDRAT